MIIAVFMLAFSVFCLAVGLCWRKPDMILIMAFMIVFSIWCLRNGHTIGAHPEPVRSAGKVVKV